MSKTLFFLSVLVLIITSCESGKEEITFSDAIRLNQIGYYPKSVKQFILADSAGSSFEVINEDGEIVFNGTLKEEGIWILSGEKLMFGDFSEVRKVGSYNIIVDGKLHSYPFEIKNELYIETLKAAIKSYYFQRASVPIEVKYGGIYKRAAGHPDDSCFYHPSTGKKEGMLNSSGGWYDAGDYGKYTGNASLSIGQMLHLLEQFPEIIPDASLNIPESGNGISDLWDELKYELDWIITMQDIDGGVYHKLTAKNFSGFIMPEEYDLERLIIGKGTASTLNFSAVLAQAYRLYKNIDPDWSAKALFSSTRAFNWALNNDSIPYKNPEDVSTGEYGDDIFSDDFYWAATELYLATGNENYGTYIFRYQQPYVHELTNSWKFFVRNNAFHSLLENRELLDTNYANALVKHHLLLADAILLNIDESPYRIALSTFEWGSNSDVLNQAMILCIAHRITGEEKYLDGAEQITDYIFGKNATGYCFLTGFGTKKVMNIHHRPSGADGIEAPIPGFIVGGPNTDKQDNSEVDYTSLFPAQSFMDVEASYASNEVCINWNAPAVFVMGYLEQVRK